MGLQLRSSSPASSTNFCLLPLITHWQKPLLLALLLALLLDAALRGGGKLTPPPQACTTVHLVGGIGSVRPLLMTPTRRDYIVERRQRNLGSKSVYELRNLTAVESCRERLNFFSSLLNDLLEIHNSVPYIVPALLCCRLIQKKMYHSWIGKTN